MIVSSEKVKQFLLDLIKNGAYRGDSLEFVLAVKREVETAVVEEPKQP